MSIEKFEDRRLYGMLNVTCKFETGPTRYWQADKAEVVKHIQRIVTHYDGLGEQLTLRQLHYQFVSHVPGYVNHDAAYKKLGKILDDCRYGGAIDWDAIVDRGRRPSGVFSVRNIGHAMRIISSSYALDHQTGQPIYLEVWTEKDALSSIISGAAHQYGVTTVVNKGYTSSSAIYAAYERFAPEIENARQCIIFYIGDHDPSGLDMIRDVRERLEFMFNNGDQDTREYENFFEVRPLALNMQQVKQYKLPPNPTKLTDSRAEDYIKNYGRTCWEVDALSPEVLRKLITDAIRSEMDMDVYEEILEREEKEKKQIIALAKKYDK